MVFKLLDGCLAHLAPLEGTEPVAEVITGVTFRDGVEVCTTSEPRAA